MTGLIVQGIRLSSCDDVVSARLAFTELCAGILADAVALNTSRVLLGDVEMRPLAAPLPLL